MNQSEQIAEGGEGAPRYQGVRQYILAHIRDGAWRPGDRIPSENDLVGLLGVSRMTVNRALRELSGEGTLTRVQGRGTFVADGAGRSDVFEVGNIAEEIRARGHAYSARLVEAHRVPAAPEIADRLGIARGSAVLHTLIVHLEDGIPAQLEDRHVNPAVVPDYLEHDFTAVTPNAVLSAAVPWSSAEHRIDAVLPQVWEARLLAVAPQDPCLLIRRRTFAAASGDGAPPVVTTVRLLIPGGRGYLESRSQPALTPG